MATIDVNGNINGSFARLIFYKSRGQYLVRTPSNTTRNKRTKEIIEPTGISELAKIAIDDINKKVWKKCSNGRTAKDMFININDECFDSRHNIQNYDQLQFSIGKIGLPKKITISYVVNNYATITINWDFEGDETDANSTDILRVFAMYGAELLIVTGLTAKRCDKVAKVILPVGLNKLIHLYLSFVDEKLENGSTTYYKKIELTR